MSISLLLVGIGVAIGVFATKKYEAYCIGNNIYTVKRLFNHGRDIESWTNGIRNWFECHPDEFKLLNIKIRECRVMIKYKSLCGKTLAFSTYTTSSSPVEKIIEPAASKSIQNNSNKL